MPSSFLGGGKKISIDTANGSTEAVGEDDLFAFVTNMDGERKLKNLGPAFVLDRGKYNLISPTTCQQKRLGTILSLDGKGYLFDHDDVYPLAYEQHTNTYFLDLNICAPDETKVDNRPAKTQFVPHDVLASCLTGHFESHFANQSAG